MTYHHNYERWRRALNIEFGNVCMKWMSSFAEMKLKKNYVQSALGQTNVTRERFFFKQLGLRIDEIVTCGYNLPIINWNINYKWKSDSLSLCLGFI